MKKLLCIVFTVSSFFFIGGTAHAADYSFYVTGQDFDCDGTVCISEPDYPIVDFRSHYDLVQISVLADTLGTYELYVSRNDGATWEQGSGSLATPIFELTSGSLVELSTYFTPVPPLRLPRDPTHPSYLTFDGDEFLIKIVVPDGANLTGDTGLYSVESFDSLYPELESPPIECDSLDLVCQGSQLIRNILVPPPGYIENEFEDFKLALEEKAPIAYIVAALEIDLSPAESASSTPTISLPINVAVAGNTTLDTSFDWTDGEGQNMVTDLAGLIRPIFVILLWMILILYIFVTIKHIL